MGVLILTNKNDCNTAVAVGAMHAAFVGTAVAANECNLGGTFNHSTNLCDCFPTFSGPTCSQLHLLPAETSSALYRNDSASWGGSVAKDSDGQYHMLFADMLGHCGLSSWECNSAISHAVAGKDHPEGPYEVVDTIVQPFAHNPTLLVHNGTWIVYHIGTGQIYKQRLTSCKGGRTSGTCGKAAGGEDSGSHRTDSSKNRDPDPGMPDVTFSTSGPGGPWYQLLVHHRHIINMWLFRRRSETNGNWVLNNPTVHIFANGSALAIYKVSCNSTIAPDPKRFCRQFAVATASSWRGPFKFHSRLEVFGEDAHLWRCPYSGAFHILFQGGESYSPRLPPLKGHFHMAYSRDGLTGWAVAGRTSENISDTEAFQADIPLRNGSTVRYCRRERHQLLLNDQGEPSHLFNGALRCGNSDHSMTSVQPLRTKAQVATASAIAPSDPTTTAAVTIDASSAIGRTASGHVGLVFDGYTTDQHDPLRTAAWANSNWVQANFSDPALRGWVKALAEPTGGDLVIRIGGGPQDSVVFAAGNYSWSPQVNKGGGCNASVFDYRIGDCVVLTPAHFDAMLDFCDDVGCKLVFGLSGMYGACCVRYDDPRVMYGTGHCPAGLNLSTCPWDDRECDATGSNRACRRWDPSNAREILLHAHERQRRGGRSKRGPFGFELGNELAAGGRTVSGDRTPAQMLDDFRTLAGMVADIWNDTAPADRPKVIGPDNDFRWGAAGGAAATAPAATAAAAHSGSGTSPGEIVAELAKLPLHAFTYHKYGGGGQTDARTFATYGSGDLGGVDFSVVRAHAPGAEVWLGEGGGQGCSEGGTTRQVRSNEVVDVFWFLDALGNTAAHGHQRFLRETIAGGWYGITNLTSKQVYPDYYGALLFARVMGRTVLNVTEIAYAPHGGPEQEHGGAPPPSPSLRAYAHCYRGEVNKARASSHSPAGAKVAVLLLNLGRDALAVTLNFAPAVTSTPPSSAAAAAAAGAFAAGDGGGEYELYRLQAASPAGENGHSVRLNGVLLELGENGEVPPMPATVQPSGAPIVMAPLDVLFAVVDVPGAMACG